MFIIKNKFIFVAISVLLVVTSIGLLFGFGLKYGIEFKGGAQSVVVYEGVRPEIESVKTALQSLEIGESLVQPAGDQEYSIKTRALTDEEHQSLLKALAFDGKTKMTEKSYNSIGPSVGRELAKKSVTAIIIVSIAIILFIAYAFRKVSEPVSSWKYGFIAITTLLHDIVIPAGMFAVFSYVTGAEVDTLFVVALLTILALSLSDTIVVFDRIRENLRINPEPSFPETVGKSLEQTYGRSINTSLTIILVLLALFFFGPESTRNFSLVLTTGLFFGTYSSIFLASPLLVIVEGMQKKKIVK